LEICYIFNGEIIIKGRCVFPWANEAYKEQQHMLK
jgi:hypothetical protein